MIVDYLAVGRAVLGAMPTQDRLVLERFFDDTGGMQLVRPLALRRPHQPGARAGAAQEVLPHLQLRAAGGGQRRRDRPVARAAPQLPARRGAALRAQPHRARTRCEHAILDSPMFLARWRWNLNRSLLVLRFRGGRKNPPPIQRMESDDLMAAVFPQAAACQDNIVGPIEIPDHLLVRQTIDDTLHEALDVDGLRALLRAHRGGRGRRSTASTPPSRRCSPTRSSPPRPYAFLDDEEFQNRRTNAVHLRRGLQVDLAAIGALDPDAIERVHDEIDPDPETADDLHDLLALARARRGARRLAAAVGRARRAGPGRRSLEHDGRELWCTTELLDDARAALAGDDDEAVAAVLRGHLEISGITTADELAARTTLARRAGGDRASRVLEHEGFALQGRYTGRRPTTSSGWPAGCWPACTPTPGAPGASASSPSPPRTSCASCCAGSTSRPGTQLAGSGGLAAVLDQLQGCEAAAVAWEPELLARAAARATSRRGSTGCATTARSAGSGSRRGRATTPTGLPARRRRPRRSRVVFRDDLGVAAGGGARRHRAAGRADRGRHRRVLEVLRERGRLLRRRARRRHPPPARRRRAGAVGRRRAGPRHVRRLRRHPGQGRRRLAAVPGPGGCPGCCGARRPRRRPRAAGRWSVRRRRTSTTSTATSSPRRSPSCSSTAGASCSATSRCTTRSCSRGATCSGRCAGSRTAASCGAAGS